MHKPNEFLERFDDEQSPRVHSVKRSKMKPFIQATYNSIVAKKPFSLRC